MITFEFVMYYFPATLGHLLFRYDQTYCKWVDANLILEYDPIRKLYLLDPIDGFMGKSWL